MREFLKKVYKRWQSPSAEVDIDNFSDDEVMRLAQNLRKGLPTATPAFDGALEQEIKDLLELADLPRQRSVGIVRRSYWS